MTLSITARCPETGMLGIGISSSSICVASRCIWARAGVGAVATQNITDPRLGLDGLDHMEHGLDASTALNRVIKEADHTAWRQLAFVDSKGSIAYFEGDKILGTYASAIGNNCIVAGNLLASKEIPQVMVEAFSKDSGDPHLAVKLINALQAGLDSGGEEGPLHSAGLLIVDTYSWPLVDLRVDWAQDNPICALRELWLDYQPQIDDYVTRAINPSSAPSYGVPGDL